MSKRGGARRIGKAALFLAIIAVALALVWPQIAARWGTDILNGVDRAIGGTGGARLAARAEPYGADPAQTVDVYVPEQRTAAPLPVLVWVHGGGWNSGAPGEYHFIGRQFARAGYVVVLVGYRLVPRGVWPHMLEDTASALAWTRANVARYGGDPQRVQIMGQSAGAYNVVAVTLDRQWLDRAGVPEGFVKSVVGLSGPYDFYPFTTDSARAAFGHVGEPALTQPLHFARAGAPPMLLLTGNKDVTVKPRNSIALARALTAAGSPAELEIVPGLAHVDTVVTLASPFDRDGRVKARVLAFLAAHGGASAPVQAKKP